jgi:hypothetical protein
VVGGPRSFLLAYAIRRFAVAMVAGELDVERPGGHIGLV